VNKKRIIESIRINFADGWSEQFTIRDFEICGAILLLLKILAECGVSQKEEP
jgi:hypothetical protein